MDAIKALAKRAVPKAASPGVGTSGIDYRRLRWRQIASAERELALMKAGEWPPEDEEGWDADIHADDWICPEGFPPGWEDDEPSHSFYDAIRMGRKLADANELALTKEELAQMRERERKMDAVKDAERARKRKEWFKARARKDAR